MRLSPRAPIGPALGVIGGAHFFAQRFNEAVPKLLLAIQDDPSFSHGAALVKAYRDRNYRVVATARSMEPSSGDDVIVVSGDIADRKTAGRAISEGMARFGRIDTLVNNAGIFICNSLNLI